jgi:hypothetical protein
MSFSLKTAKELRGAIVKINKVSNKILFYEANNLLVPKKIVLTQNLKSIDVTNFPMNNSRDIDARYITEFYYHNDTKVDRLDWYYAYYEHNWEKETTELINKTIELV